MCIIEYDGCRDVAQHDKRMNFVAQASKFRLSTEVLSISVQSWKIIQEGHNYKSIFIVRYIFNSENASTSSTQLAPLTLPRSDQNTGCIFMWHSDLRALIPNCTWAIDDSQGQDEQMCCVARSALSLRCRGRGVWLGHWQLIQAHTLQVVQVVGVQRSLFLCVCVCEREIDRRGIANNHSL